MPQYLAIQTDTLNKMYVDLFRSLDYLKVMLYHIFLTSISVCFAPIQACVIKNLTLPGEAWNSVTLFTLLEAERIESVSGSSKIQTLCHMTQVLLKLRFTTMERLSSCFLHLQRCRYITN